MARNLNITVKLKPGTNDIEAAIRRLTKEVEEKVIQKGLDEPIQKDVNELRNRLRITVNEEILSQKTAVPGNPINIGDNENWSDILASESAVFKYLSGFESDVLTDGSTPIADVDAEIIAVSTLQKVNKDGEQTMLIRMQQPIEDDSSFEEHKNKVITSINSSIFAVIDGSNRLTYYLNPGIDLRKYVKAHCAHIGQKGKKAVTDEDRFNTAKEKGQMPIWMLRQAVLEEEVFPHFINLNSVITDVKNGQYDNAIIMLESAKTGSLRKSLEGWIDKIRKIRDRKVDPEAVGGPEIITQSNIIHLINNLRVDKEIKKSGEVIYSLTSSYSLESNRDIEFWPAVHRLIVMWKVGNYSKWYNDLRNVAKKVTSSFRK